MSLYEKISELEEKRASLIEEMKKKESPTEERERLLRQVCIDAFFVFFNSCCFVFQSTNAIVENLADILLPDFKPKSVCALEPLR